MKVWVTKYALTKGIQEVEVDRREDSQYCYSKDQWRVQYVGLGKEWHLTRDSAVTRANEMRRAKLSSLRKSFAKFEKLNFV
jgi:hypothetical protein